jgi:hypothetical protein
MKVTSVRGIDIEKPLRCSGGLSAKSQNKILAELIVAFDSARKKLAIKSIA